MIKLSKLDQFRMTPPDFWMGRGWLGDDLCGCFRMKFKPGCVLRVIASNGDGWEHVSVSHEHRCPTWEEMSWIASKFFGEETAMQLHVPSSDHINYHKYCLHWWRPHNYEIPRPEHWMVGPKEERTA